MTSGVTLGPILFAASSSADTWKFSIGCYVENPPDDGSCPYAISFDDATVVQGAAEPRGDFKDVAGSGGVFFVTPVEVPRTANARFIGYRIDPVGEDKVYGLPFPQTEGMWIHVAIPATGAVPKAAFFSCSGVSHREDLRDIDDPFRLWRNLAEQHTSDPFNLLIGGGDQLYCDDIWSDAQLDFWDCDRVTRSKKKVSKQTQTRIRQKYLRYYQTRFNRAWPQGAMMAQVPGLYTWDDHEIFDGYGSHEDDDQNSPTFKALFETARRAFVAFQLGGKQNCVASNASHCLQHVRFAGTDSDLDVVLLDLRSERTRRTVMSKEQWRALRAVLDEHEQGKGRKRHLLIVSTIPVVYMRFWRIASALRTEITDDLFDQWENQFHRGERARLVNLLLKHQNDADAAVTILSGDVHVGSRARITSTEREHVRPHETSAVIDQVTSSGIVHPPPKFWQWALIKAGSDDGPDDIGPRVRSDILPVGADRYLYARNWLSITPDDQPKRGLMWFQWWTANGAVEPNAVVAPGPPPPQF